MPILDGDIKLLKSAVLDDVPEGGGMATGIAVVDGVSNNLFNDISQLDRTYGRISLRKVFPAVLTDTVDGYYGTNVIIAQPPSDANVSASLFTTRDWSDDRAAAQSRLESYLALGAESRYVLYGNHLAGQRSVQVYCRHDVPSPGIGDVLALVKAAPATEQYVRITRLVSRIENQVFTDGQGDFYRDTLVMEVSDALRVNFPAAAPSRYTADVAQPPTRVHLTFAADATSYYGISPLAQAAYLGQMTLHAHSVFTQLVPSARAETPIADARCLPGRDIIVPISGAAPLTVSATLNTAPGELATRHFGSAVAPGSVSIVAGSVTLVDNSAGALVATGGWSGSIDYTSGALALAMATGYAGPVTLSAQPAAAIASAGHSAGTAVSVGNRGYSYVKSLLPLPAPGSISVDYMAQGKWYRLTDNGAGGLSGSDGTGTGTINYATGSLIVTLGALPDVNTDVLYAWGSPAHYESHVGGSVFTQPTIKIDIAAGALEPGQLTLTYTSGGVTKTVTDNGAGGLAGDGSGTVNYASGKVRLVPGLLPDGGTAIGVSYKQGMLVTELKTAAGALTNFTLGSAVEPKSLTIVFTDGDGGIYTLSDDGAGLLVFRAADVSAAVHATTNAGGVRTDSQCSVLSTAGIHGTINYATGAVALNGQVSLQVRQQIYTATSGTWQDLAVSTVAAGTITCRYRQDNDTAGATQTFNVPAPAIVLDLLPAISNAIVPGSLRIALASDIYVDRAGALIKNPSAVTNSGTIAGAINYATGIATLDSFAAGIAPTVSVACITRRGTWQEYAITWRVSGAPIQPASLSVRASRASDSTQINASSALNGDLSGAALGSIDFEFGIARVKFGAMVADASLTLAEKSEWWYDPAAVVGGQIFRPTLVFPETAYFNAVAVSSLPLSADVLGLDPVRLPPDGRVPMLRKGDVLVVHHTASTAPAAVANGQTVNLGRVRVARARVIGNDGNTITTGYTANLDAGTVTFTNVSGYSQPVTIEHRIEDMTLCSDAQINGELAINSPLTHDFPLGSHVSSALLMGDLHARVSIFFDQQTWQGWSDELQGSAATGTYNKTQYPPVVTNRGAIEERWYIVFTNTTTISVIGETVGQIVSGHGVAVDLAPINPQTGVPYFTLAAIGWGAGWSAGNVLRFNTHAANFPVWVARTVLQGPASAQSDHFTIGIRGDIDNP